MSKVLSFIEAVFSGVQSFAKQNPALAAVIVTELTIVLAHFGLHVSAGQLATDLAVLSAILGGLVHVSTKPRKAGEHEIQAHDHPIPPHIHEPNGNLPSGLH